ncbi:hypothetical protein C7I87_22905 [Mesorhizobium sp. SARCC-RB16n]|uniref:hypothetical protein n=1 Tax=Mesorhizobium sp. SARCC-RB16n TaxID=2116687 RepID=UPI00122ED764|nr:hypothetical protein [Mesorhizobium sp. SARCC-RB16n]KAA3448167.1 hypothetical protein C7I87_22905 [Mesorhizobium sp. SARCC-RB16n]
MTSAVQVWNPDDWELFSLSLLQHRHGTLNVHKIPAAHKGDYGIDYYCAKEAVAYQCYVVEEPVDIATRAERQKKKITTDLRKIIANSVEIAKLFMGVPIKHWVLLAPNHDSKEVNLHCSKKTLDMRDAKCPALDITFEVGIHDPGSFPKDAVAVGMSTVSSVKLSIPTPSQQELDTWAAGSSNLLTNATQKLGKRTGPDHVHEAVAEAAKSFLQGNALLDALRNGSPDLHEKIMSAINSRARRLQFAGPQGVQTPGSILHTELDSLISAMRTAAPNLSEENAEQIAYGSICEWIMRCPLDFPNVQ